MDMGVDDGTDKDVGVGVDDNYDDNRRMIGNLQACFHCKLVLSLTSFHSFFYSHIPYAKYIEKVVYVPTILKNNENIYKCWHPLKAN